MASLNRVEIIGYVGNKPEIRVMPNGDMVANMSIATSESWTDKTTNEKQERTTWHRIVLFRNLAETAERYLQKGSLVRIEGKLVYRQYTDQFNVERVITEIYASNLLMLGRAEKKAPVNPSGSNQGDGQGDDIPF